MTKDKMNMKVSSAICIILLFLLSGPVSAEITVHVLDIGQGDAILLESKGEWMLFDAGSRATTVDIVQQYGVTHLDYFVTSHPDADHIGGAAAIINSVPIGIYADSGASHTTRIYENMMTALIEKEVSYAELVKGDSWTLGDAIIEVLSSGEGTSNNDKSVVLHITDGDVTFLLPGDKEDIVNWDARILVVPHHGSAGLHLGNPPEVALISAGQNNKYRHPTQETLDLLEASGSEVYRTDQDGTITVISDGENYTIHTAYNTAKKLQNDKITEIEIREGGGSLQEMKADTSSIEEEFTLRVLDIGQGDAILLESKGEWMLFDAGPRATTVDIVQQYGVTHLDYFVTSHPDADHIGGAAAIINSVPIDIYADSGASHTTRIYENMMTALVEKEVSYAELVKGDRWTLGDTTIEVLSSGEGSSTNDKSVVLYITHDELTFLLPGDKEDIASWDARILVVPHHGSAGLHLGNPPEIALISAGKNNKYGHPTQETVDLLEAFGSEVYRTDQDGTITVVSNGKKYTVFTENEGQILREEEGENKKEDMQESMKEGDKKKKRDVQEDGFDKTKQKLNNNENKEAPCDCSRDLMNCGSFTNREEAQTCYEYCVSLGKGDIHRLDLNNDGFACDSLR